MNKLRPPDPRAARAPGRARERPGHPRVPRQLAARHRARLQGRLRPPSASRSTSSSAPPAAHTAPPSRSAASPTRPSAKRSATRRLRQGQSKSSKCSTCAGATFDHEPSSPASSPPSSSAAPMNNFGVQLLLDGFLEHSTRARARGRPPAASIAPDDAGVLRLRLQDPGQHGPAAPRPHRVRPRLLRQVRARHGRHPRRAPAKRSASPARTSSSASDRETVDEAYAGDVIGLGRPLRLRHRRHADRGPADRLQRDPPLRPRVLRLPARDRRPAQFKQFREGLDQLLQEGVVQVVQRPRTPAAASRCSAAVGPLQFEVVQYRLQSEVRRRLPPRKRPLGTPPLGLAPTSPSTTSKRQLPSGGKLAFDAKANPPSSSPPSGP